MKRFHCVNKSWIIIALKNTDRYCNLNQLADILLPSGFYEISENMKYQLSYSDSLIEDIVHHFLMTWIMTYASSLQLCISIYTTGTSWSTIWQWCVSWQNTPGCGQSGGMLQSNNGGGIYTIYLIMSWIMKKYKQMLLMILEVRNTFWSISCEAKHYSAVMCYQCILLICAYIHTYIHTYIHNICHSFY